MMILAAVAFPTPLTVAAFTKGTPNTAVKPTPGCVGIAPFKSVG